MQLNMYEIFEEFEKAPTKEEKKAVLLRNNTWSMQTLLRNTYHPHIRFNVERVPYYRPDAECPPGMSYSNMSQALRRAYVFDPAHKNYVALDPERSNQVLVQILESLEAREAIVYMNMLLKKPQAKGLDAKFVKETFPGLLE